MSVFIFPLYHLLSLLDNSIQTSFFYYILIQILIILILGLAKYLYKGQIKLKLAVYLIELISPDIFLYLVYNFLTLSPIDYYAQVLGFFIGFTLYIQLCILGPIIIMNDIEVYKTAKLLFTGLKVIRKEW